MTISDIFFNETNGLRAFWRILLFLVLLVLALIALSGIGLLLKVDDSPSGLFVQKLLEFASFAIPTAIVVKVTEHRSFGSVGFGLSRGWVRQSIYGIAFGAALVAAAILPGALAGGLTMVRGTPDATLALAFVFFSIAAAGEELLCRGFMLQALASGIGRIAATVIMSALFALLHAANPDVTYTALATTFLAGVLLSIAYFRTGNLWLATGVHFGWNFAMGYVLGLPVSGLRFFPDAPVFISTPGEPAWLTGGAYGPEGAEIAAALLALGCAVLLWLPIPIGPRSVTREA